MGNTATTLRTIHMGRVGGGLYRKPFDLWIPPPLGLVPVRRAAYTLWEWGGGEKGAPPVVATGTSRIVASGQVVPNRLRYYYMRRIVGFQSPHNFRQ